jgi:hypothetical protein
VLTDVVKALADVDPHPPVVEALLAAHSSVLSDVIDGTGPVTLQRMKSGFFRRKATALQRILAA